MRAYRQGVSVYVIGTNDIQTALKTAGISPETHKWSSTEFGTFVRRQGYWRANTSDRPPIDAKAGIAFIGPIRKREDGAR
jgi:hypothetical protein